MFFERKTALPTTPEQLDEFMALIISKFGLPDTDDTRDSICTLIMHMPQSISRAPLSYFANSVKKSMANKAAYDKLAEYRDKRKAAAEAEAKAADVTQLSDEVN